MDMDTKSHHPPQDQRDPDDGGGAANPLKNEGQSKSATSALADQARPSRTSVPAGETVTGQGGSPKGHGRDDHASPGPRGPVTAHPSQHGGVKATDPDADPRARAAGSPSGVKTRGPSPADERRSDRTGTAPDRGGAPTRSGRTKGQRRREGRDV